MQLQAVAAAMYTRNDAPQFCVSTVSGAKSDDIRVAKTEVAIFDPRSERETLAQYDRLMAAILDAAKVQRSESPRERLITVFGAPSDFPVSVVTYHALQRFRAVIGGGADKLRAEITAAPNAKENFEVLGAGIGLHANMLCAADGTDVEMILRRFIDYSANADPDWQPGPREAHSLEILNMLRNAAIAGDSTALGMLQSTAVTMGRSFAVRANLTKYDEARFLRPHPQQVAGLDILRLLDLRERFAEGIRQITGWDFSMCIKLPGDPPNPAFSDVAGCFLADQLNAAAGIKTPGIVLVH